MKTFAFIALTVLVLSATPCQGQIMPSMVYSSMRTRPNGVFEIRATYKLEPGPVPALSGGPFSAQKVFQNDQELTDGTHISRQSPTIHTYQDSAGNIRIEWPFKKPDRCPPQWELPLQVEIINAAAGYHYILDTVHRVAHRGAIEIIPRKPAPPLPQNPAPNAPIQTTDSARPQSSTETLGSMVIDGLAVEGKRTTTTYPAGSRMGNDRPVTTSSEVWVSPELNLPAFKKTSDPRSGDEKSAYFNIDRTEPDPSLFQVPTDYQIVDEPGPFAIIFTFRLNESGKLEPVK
jgi:hypothetical protein